MVQPAPGTLETLTRTHLDALHTSSWLSSHFREHHQPMAIDVKPEHVIKVLHSHGIKCVLMGAHGLNVYRRQARATQDVDVLVRKKDIRKAVNELQKAFPTLKVRDTPVVTRFIDPVNEMAVLDLMKPTQKVFQAVFRHTVRIGVTHEIPDLEMALVSKFAALTSPHRERLRKMQDVVDFAEITDFNKEKIDQAKLRRLADQVYPNGGQEITELVENILAGRPLQV